VLPHFIHQVLERYGRVVDRFKQGLLRPAKWSDRPTLLSAVIPGKISTPCTPGEHQNSW